MTKKKANKKINKVFSFYVCACFRQDVGDTHTKKKLIISKLYQKKVEMVNLLCVCLA